MNKIGRNDPCPCGSGKKYKKCCIDKPILEIEEMVPRLNYENSMQHFGSFWTYDEVNQISTEEIINKLISLGIPFEKETFLEDIEKFCSAEELSDNWFTTFKVTAKGRDEDFPWIAAWILWERLAPSNKMCMEQMSDLVEKGYEYMEKNDSRSASDIWLDVWEAIKYRTKPGFKTLDYFDNMFTESFFITNFVQDLADELFNAGSENPAYYEKCIKYCKEFCSYFPEQSGTIIHNMRTTIAECYLYLKRVDEAKKELDSLIRDYPDNPWSYITYGDMYNNFVEGVPKDFKRAREFYEKALLFAKDEIDKQIIEDKLKDLN
ncbi:MAG TPA: hypothetical protein GXX14_12890 [Clostridiaceae bacterium]|nr:hypothetical protein [Clostridiaceae bacterium]